MPVMVDTLSEGGFNEDRGRRTNREIALYHKVLQYSSRYQTARDLLPKSVRDGLREFVKVVRNTKTTEGWGKSGLMTDLPGGKDPGGKLTQR